MEKYILISSFIIICIITFFSFTIIAPKITNINLLPKSETYTELYFNNSNELPFLVAPDKSQPFSFTVHNKENKNMKYSYEVAVYTNKQKTILDTNMFILPDNQAKVIKENLQVASTAATEVVITLKNKNQQIHFQVNRQDPNKL